MKFNLMMATFLLMACQLVNAQDDGVYVTKVKTFKTNFYIGLFVKQKNGAINGVRTGHGPVTSGSLAGHVCKENGFSDVVKVAGELVPYASLIGSTVQRATHRGLEETFIPFNAADLVGKKRYSDAVKMSKSNLRLPIGYQSATLEINECIEHILYLRKIKAVTCSKVKKES